MVQLADHPRPHPRDDRGDGDRRCPSRLDHRRGLHEHRQRPAADRAAVAGERAAAEKALDAYQVYERDDRHIRALNRGGDLRGAIAFDTSYAPGNSNWAFTQCDNALVALIAINQRAFTGAISAGQQDTTGWTGLIPGATVVLIGIFVFAGVRPRLAEYR